MKTATVRELRNNFGQLAHWLAAGETVQVLKRGKAFARLIPEPKPNRPLLGCMSGTARIPKDIDAPVSADWEANS